MRSEAYECIVGRVLDYLSRSGVELTPSAVCRALKVVEDAVSEGERGALQRAFDRLARRFDLPAVRIASVAPPIHRASVGYPHRGRRS